MKILLTNDDGIHSKGLEILSKRLCKDGHEIWVFAPKGQMSATSHHIQFHTPIFLEKTELSGATVAYAVDGTPADCVTLALKCLNLLPDLIISGPNKGANVALDVIYSGTVAAAEEGAICNIKSIALSSNSHTEPIYETACEYVASNLEKLMSVIKPDTFLSVNAPNLPYDKVKGVKVATQGNRRYADYYEERTVDGKIGYSLEGMPELPSPQDNTSDSYFLLSDYITVTPFKLDRTEYSLLEICKEKFE